MKKSLLVSCILLLSGIHSFAQWEWQNPLPQENSLKSVCFPDATTGYAVGDAGTILKTTNGGTTVINEAKQPDNSESSLKVFPDPATERITVEPSKPGINMNGTISLYGMTGQELVKQQVQGLKVQINVSSLPSGLYFVKLANKEKTEFGKFVKE